MSLRNSLGGILAGAALIATTALAQEEPQTHRIVIEEFAFVPERITVQAGDTVEWINRDIVPHTATAADGAWDTGTLAREEKGRMRFPAVGRSDYFCAFHPHMRAYVTVKTRSARRP